MERGVLTREQLSSALAGLVERYGARAAYLFGSYARAEADGDSDVDVLIDGGPAFRKTDVFAIAEELHRAFGKRVDVYEVSELEEGHPFYNAVMRDRVLVA